MNRTKLPHRFLSLARTATRIGTTAPTALSPTTEAELTGLAELVNGGYNFYGRTGSNTSSPVTWASIGANQNRFDVERVFRSKRLDLYRGQGIVLATAKVEANKVPEARRCHERRTQGKAE